jgi:hypothetical protein
MENVTEKISLMANFSLGEGGVESLDTLGNFKKG